MDIATCKWRSDLVPQVSSAAVKNALEITKEDLKDCDYIITNPPFSWVMLKPLLEYLPTLKPTWLLLPSDCMHNVRMSPYVEKCSSIVSVGRLYFHKQGEDETKVKYSRGTANFCWYFWEQHPTKEYRTKFYGRQPNDTNADG